MGVVRKQGMTRSREKSKYDLVNNAKSLKEMIPCTREGNALGHNLEKVR